METIYRIYFSSPEGERLHSEYNSEFAARKHCIELNNADNNALHSYYVKPARKISVSRKGE